MRTIVKQHSEPKTKVTQSPHALLLGSAMRVPRWWGSVLTSWTNRFAAAT